MSSFAITFPLATLALILPSLVLANPFLVRRALQEEDPSSSPSSSANTAVALAAGCVVAGCVVAAVVAGTVYYRRRGRGPIIKRDDPSSSSTSAVSSKAHLSPLSMNASSPSLMDQPGGGSGFAAQPRSKEDRLGFIHAVKTIPHPQAAHISRSLGEAEADQAMAPPQVNLGVPMASVPHRTDRPIWVESTPSSVHEEDFHEDEDEYEDVDLPRSIHSSQGPMIDQEHGHVTYGDSPASSVVRPEESLYQAHEYSATDDSPPDHELYEIALGADMGEWTVAQNRATPI
ncbi:MAG: hypothetical protein DHS80DRAFT_21599 [Piptocephalis tieghemiana]|nr:MAG: hypothetical protein DHS80DRAFT_21599 [Piptocephalis tieghemiana]